MPNPDAQHDVAGIIAELDERGYCVIPAVIPVEKADRVRTILERILAQEADEISHQRRTQRVGRIAVKHPIFLELLTHPLIVAIWRRYLDEDMVCATWTANTTYPGYNRYGWHPDWPYQRLNQPWPTDRISGQTMWLLDDFSADNGGTGIIPYSHRKGHRPSAGDGVRLAPRRRDPDRCPRQRDGDARSDLAYRPPQHLERGTQRSAGDVYRGPSTLPRKTCAPNWRTWTTRRSWCGN